MKDKNETEKGFYSESEEEGEEEADSSGTTESADSGEDDSDEEESGTRGSCLDLCSHRIGQSLPLFTIVGTFLCPFGEG